MTRTSYRTTRTDAPTTATTPRTTSRRWSRSTLGLAGLTVAICLAHGGAIWLAMEGKSGLTNGWPLWRDDHPLYFHSALVTRHFLRQSGTTAGYDPAFMSGYAKSVVFPASSTLPELVIALSSGILRPELAYKLYVLVAAALIPWLIAASALLWRGGVCAALVAVSLFLLYVWTDFPINYAAFGMLPYLLAVPFGLVATATLARYVGSGSVGWWFAAVASLSLVVLVHFTSALIVAPASAVVYGASVFPHRDGEPTYSWRRHAGVWLVPCLVLVLNAFWWWPGVWLSSTKGASDFAFAHPEGVLIRLRQIMTTEAPIERVLILAGLPCAWYVLRTERVPGAGLLVFVAAGFFWGYLAGGLRSLDFLQPGRHTYAFYSGLTVAAGLGIERGLAGLRERSRWRLDLAVALGLSTALGWFLGPILWSSVQVRVRGPHPFLSSRPTPRMLWVFRRIGQHVRPGERLLYEEGGFGIPGVPDPFQGGRFSGLLSDRFGIEVIGGPYLHASLTTNFTQFGEGKLFERADWGRERFVRYAKVYRPSAVLCWSPRARGFCRDNPDLIDVKDDDGAILIGRVKGFGGAAVSGTAEVKATPGRLRVTRAEGGLDGSVVLRYHSVPCLRSVPPVPWEPVFLENDPVPFIRLRPPFGTSAFELRFPPG